MSADAPEQIRDDQPPPVLRSLAPAFHSSDHGLYLQLLRAAIDGQPTVRNIALAGGYGTGKSSILEPLDEEYPGEVVSLSLSSVAAAGSPESEVAARNPTASTPTNRIQREIVKQLLYRLPPKDVPQSRFRRIDTPPKPRELVIAGAVAAAAVALCYALAWPRSYATDSGVSWWRTLLANLIVAAVAGSAAWLVQWLMRDRVALDSVKAGPATITLSPRSTSYFDEYLDEIVYFFQVSKCRIVVIEDLDRFEDVHIFETLRALNTLLNRTTQLEAQWPIRFIYAARDSIFDQAEMRAMSAQNPEPIDDLVRANRTKFFDLVIPVVPFITHRNARDLLGEQITASTDKVPRELVNIVARHVADMRLILNIRNEFEVFHRRLLMVEHPMPGLDEAHLFALIAFKNVSPSDFDAIRVQHSCLDTLYERWRKLVDANITASADAAHLTSTASDFGRRLKEQLDVLARHSGSDSTPSFTLMLGNTAVSSDDVETVGFWQRLTAGGELRVIHGRSRFLQMPAAAVSTLLGRTIDPKVWGTNDAERAERQRILQREELDFLKHHEWSALCNRTEFTVSIDGMNDSKPMDFPTLLKATVTSPLARDLIRAGYLNQHFALYASSFHGKHLRPAAMEYVMRYVEHGEPGMLHQLEAADVEAILADWGTEVLTDRSMRNVTVMDHLLATRPSGARSVIGGLLGWSGPEREFADAYLQQGADPAEFVRLLAERLPAVFAYLVEDAPVDDAQRTTLVDAALQGSDQQLAYAADESVRAHLEQHPQQFTALSAPKTAERAAAAVRVLKLCGVQLASLTGLAPETLDAVIDQDTYLVNASTLATLAGATDFPLDVLRAKDQRIYARVVDDLQAFLDAVAASRATAHTIKDPGTFVEILNDISEADAAIYVIDGADRRCVVATLMDVPPRLWPELAAERRTARTTTNLTAYLQEFGDVVDAPLAELLKTPGAITVDRSTDEASRMTLAIAILNARRGLLHARRRVQLVASLQLTSPIPTARIEPMRGDLVGLLLSRRLIADDTDAFTPRLMLDWDTREAAIVASKSYAGFLAAEYLPTAEVADLLASVKIAASIKQAVVGDLRTFLSRVAGVQARRIADTLVAGGFEPTADGLAALMAGGAPASAVMPLLARCLKHLTDAELVGLLEAMGGEHARAVDRGNSRVAYLPDDAAHRDVLDRLVGAHVVHHHEPGDAKKHPGLRKVTLSRSA